MSNILKIPILQPIFRFNSAINSTLPIFEISKNKGNPQICSRFVAEKLPILWVFMGFHGGSAQFSKV
jgi:hypothetical protein